MQLVHKNGERLFVTSLDISNKFGKQHKDVLRAIDNLDCSTDFRQRNFAPTVYHRPNPSGGKGIPAPMFEITRDGFVFLCMGFTGPQAALWKERYIEAFNQMEAALRGAVPAPRQELALAQEIGALRDMVAAQSQAIIGLYQQLDGARLGHLRALSRVVNLQNRQHKLLAAQEKRDARETILRLEAEGVPREVIAQRTGRTFNHIRQVIFQAKQAGAASAQGELGLEAAR